MQSHVRTLARSRISQVSSTAVPRIHFHRKTAQSCLSTGKVSDRHDQRRGLCIQYDYIL